MPPLFALVVGIALAASTQAEAKKGFSFGGSAKAATGDRKFDPATGKERDKGRSGVIIYSSGGGSETQQPSSRQRARPTFSPKLPPLVASEPIKAAEPVKPAGAPIPVLGSTNAHEPKSLGAFRSIN